jgi:hypothetical protein
VRKSRKKKELEDRMLVLRDKIKSLDKEHRIRARAASVAEKKLNESREKMEKAETALRKLRGMDN